jgi:hypothetical protein
VKEFGKIALLAVGFVVLAVALTSIPNRLVSASQGPPSKPDPTVTQQQVVTLVCGRFTSNICTDLERVAADGTLTPYTAPPSGFVLVVTDFVWKSTSVIPGQVAFATLHHQLTSPPHDVAFSAVVATPDGAAVSESHFTSGLPFSDVPIVFVSHTPDVTILQGYLVER